VHSLESYLHQLWFNMLHSEQDGLDYSTELVRAKLEVTLRAVFYNVLNQLKKCMSEFWVACCVSLYHFESALAQP